MAWAALLTPLLRHDAGPYLNYVKRVSLKWPNLKPLADFMEVGTDPLRWRNFCGDDPRNAYTYPDDVDKRSELKPHGVTIGFPEAD